MIGAPVTIDDLKAILLKKEAEKKARRELEEPLRAELSAIKKGECLRYDLSSSTEYQFQLRFLISSPSIKGLKFVREGNYIYVYKE